jgi:hypothetical protein
MELVHSSENPVGSGSIKLHHAVSVLLKAGQVDKARSYLTKDGVLTVGFSNRVSLEQESIVRSVLTTVNKQLSGLFQFDSRDPKMVIDSSAGGSGLSFATVEFDSSRIRFVVSKGITPDEVLRTLGRMEHSDAITFSEDQISMPTYFKEFPRGLCRAFSSVPEKTLYSKGVCTAAPTQGHPFCPEAGSFGPVEIYRWQPSANMSALAHDTAQRAVEAELDSAFKTEAQMTVKGALPAIFGGAVGGAVKPWLYMLNRGDSSHEDSLRFAGVLSDITSTTICILSQGILSVDAPSEERNVNLMYVQGLLGFGVVAARHMGYQGLPNAVLIMSTAYSFASDPFRAGVSVALGMAANTAAMFVSNELASRCMPLIDELPGQTSVFDTRPTEAVEFDWNGNEVVRDEPDAVEGLLVAVTDRAGRAVNAVTGTAWTMAESVVTGVGSTLRGCFRRLCGSRRGENLHRDEFDGIAPAGLPDTATPLRRR